MPAVRRTGGAMFGLFEVGGPSFDLAVRTGGPAGRGRAPEGKAGLD